MNSDLGARLGAVVKALNEQAAAALPRPSCVEERLGMQLKPGDVVLDSVTGEEGVVISGRLSEQVVSAGNAEG